MDGVVCRYDAMPSAGKLAPERSAQLSLLGAALPICLYISLREPYVRPPFL